MVTEEIPERRFGGWSIRWVNGHDCEPPPTDEYASVVR